MRCQSGLCVLLLFQWIPALIAFRSFDVSTNALARTTHSHLSRNSFISSESQYFSSNVPATFSTSNHNVNKQAHVLFSVAPVSSSSSPTQSNAMHPERPMLQSIDESKFKFNLLERVTQWPKKKTEAVRDFFHSNLPMLQFLWPKDNPKLKVFLVLSMVFMFFGKWFNLRVPFLMQRTVDMITTHSPDGAHRQILLSLLLYGLARTMSTVCAEIKTCLFVHVSQHVQRQFALQIFRHLHSLDASFHLATPSGVISVAYVRAVRGFQTMLFQLVFSVAPTFLELAMVSRVLYRRFDPIFALVTLCTFTAYLLFTVWVTQWRVHLRQALVDVDNARNGFFIDSIVNHEVVKLFHNEDHETARFDTYLQQLQTLSIDSTVAIAWLNLGQACMFSLGLIANLWIAYHRVRRHTMSLGDLLAVNAMLLQLAVPFNFIGYTYQELRQSFVDMGYIREILAGQKTQAHEAPDTPSLDVLAPRKGPSALEFRNVTFRYTDQQQEEEEGEDSVHQLRNVSFRVLPGQSVAIVGPSGSGKSTTLKLITRLVDPLSGEILVDGVPTQTVSRASLLSRIAVVPQDCSLFDDTIEYNIRYGAPPGTTSNTSLQEAIDKAHLGPVLRQWPLGVHTLVGERGAKLSGGERQKVSIARAVLRHPSLILCDEVTASVDAFAEREIVETLRDATVNCTTVTVAHRLSSIAHVDLILVMQRGHLVEQGTHETLLTKTHGVYRAMWVAQNLLDDDGHPQLAQQDSGGTHHRRHHQETQVCCVPDEDGQEVCRVVSSSSSVSAGQEATQQQQQVEDTCVVTEIVPCRRRQRCHTAEEDVSPVSSEEVSSSRSSSSVATHDVLLDAEHHEEERFMSSVAAATHVDASLSSAVVS